MIDEFEIAKSNQSKCSRCSKSIKKGEHRGVEKYDYFGSPCEKFYCVKCSGKIIKEAREELNKLTRKLIWNAKKFGLVK